MEQYLKQNMMRKSTGLEPGKQIGLKASLMQNLWQYFSQNLDSGIELGVQEQNQRLRSKTRVSGVELGVQEQNQVFRSRTRGSEEELGVQEQNLWFRNKTRGLGVELGVQEQNQWFRNKTRGLGLNIRTISINLTEGLLTCIRCISLYMASQHEKQFYIHQS